MWVLQLSLLVLLLLVLLLCRGDDKPVSARLQHQPSGVYFSIVEPDLQSGNAVAHVIDVLPPASVLSRVAVAPEATSHTWQYRFVIT